MRHNTIVSILKKNIHYYNSEVFDYLNYCEDNLYIASKKDPNIILSIQCSVRSDTVAVHRVINSVSIHNIKLDMLPLDNDLLKNLDELVKTYEE